MGLKVDNVIARGLLYHQNGIEIMPVWRIGFTLSFGINILHFGDAKAQSAIGLIYLTVRFYSIHETLIWSENTAFGKIEVNSLEPTYWFLKKS